MKEKNIPIRVLPGLHDSNNNKRFCDLVFAEGKFFLETKQARNRIRMPLEDFMHQLNRGKEVLQ